MGTYPDRMDLKQVSSRLALPARAGMGSPCRSEVSCNYVELDASDEAAFTALFTSTPHNLELHIKP